MAQVGHRRPAEKLTIKKEMNVISFFGDCFVHLWVRKREVFALQNRPCFHFLYSN